MILVSEANPPCWGKGHPLGGALNRNLASLFLAIGVLGPISPQKVKPMSEYEKAHKVVVAVEAHCELWYRSNHIDQLDCIKRGIESHLEGKEFQPWKQ